MENSLQHLLNEVPPVPSSRLAPEIQRAILSLYGDKRLPIRYITRFLQSKQIDVTYSSVRYVVRHAQSPAT